MEWTDEAIVLGVRAHGEAHAVLTVFARAQGRHLGLVHGGASRKTRPLLQPGNLLKVQWRARLADHLGTFSVELLHDRASLLLDDRKALLALTAVCALAAGALPEREPAPGLYDGMEVLLSAFDKPEVWPAVLIRWELGLLEVMGFGLDLNRCAVTGSYDDLTHVSPKSGRAVSHEAAKPYLDKLLPLPPFLLASQAGAPSPQDIANGLRLTGHFLARHVFAVKNEPLPEARLRLAEALAEPVDKPAPGV